MRIGIDATAALETRRTGVGNYVAQLLTGLHTLDSGGASLELTLFANREAQPGTGTPAGLPPGEPHPLDAARSATKHSPPATGSLPLP